MQTQNKIQWDRSYVIRAISIGVLDVLSVWLSFAAALWLRYDFQMGDIPQQYLEILLYYGPFWCLICVVAFGCLHLYDSIWAFASAEELLHIVAAYCALVPLLLLFSTILPAQMPTSFYVAGMILSLICTTTIRFSYRLLRQWKQLIGIRLGLVKAQSNVMIIGAGEAGRMLLNEYRNSNYVHQCRVRCIIDDDPAKLHTRLNGVPVAGTRQDIPKAVAKYNIHQIIFAIPTSSAQDRREILDICGKTDCQIQELPGTYQILTGQVSVAKLRKVNVLDLLGRDPIVVNNEEIFSFISGKTVLVTGGGGSIGSELCRQIASSNPKQLIIFDIYENNAYAIQQELKRSHPELNLVTLIGSVRNTNRVNYVIRTYRPELVVHAAAHKHVPLMEDSPNEAIKNNVFGTYKMAQAASRYGVQRFVLISTDKAVNPTNIMGASKRLCEMVVQMMNRKSKTEFVAVRFGNVLGSNGSVIPLFEQQIAEGGPVTVTDPEMTRYFMTIPEAVSLVLQAGYYAKGGEIFVLDMGKPVFIDQMARKMIRLSGYEPDVDIKIQYIGLRPGEKKYEELLMGEEGLQDTANKLIHIGKPIEMDDELFQKQLGELDRAYRDENADMKALVAKIVPTYHPGTHG